MQPTKKNNRTKVAWVASLTSLALIFSVSNAYSRLIDWTSVELVYTPGKTASYSSDCLRPGGQQIVLSDWQMEEMERVVTIAVRRPAPTETVLPTDFSEESTVSGTMETVIPEETQVPTAESADVTEPESTENSVPEDTGTTQPQDSVPTEGSEATNDQMIPETPEDATAETFLDTGDEDPVPTIEPTEEASEETTVPTEETTAPTEETTLPTEESSEATEGSTVQTEFPTESTEEDSGPTDDSTKNTETSDPVDTEASLPEETWDPAEVTVTMNEIAAQHLSYEVRVEEEAIRLLLKRSETAAGLQETVQAAIHVAWNGLEGTFCLNILPYGMALIDDTETESTTGATGVDGLEIVSASGIMDPERMVTCIKLNTQALTDYTLTFRKGNEEMHMVRWSMDGESYFMLYDRNELTVAYPYAKGWDGMLYLDFGLALEEKQLPTILVAASGYESVTVEPVLQPLPEISQHVIKTVEFPWTLEMETKWGGLQPELLPIQHLITDEEGYLSYVDDASMKATVTDDGILLEFAQEAVYPASGSYRMTLQWIWNDTVVEEQIIYFFINTN